MKKLVFASLAMVLAVAASAGVIYDLNMDMYAEGDIVVVEGAVVTAVRSSGFSITENANGPYGACWVYTGTGNHSNVIGDVVNLTGEYDDYYGLTEIKNLTQLDTVGNAPVDPFAISAAGLAADHEAFEACVISIGNDFTVDELLSYGEWLATADDGTQLQFDDYWFDESGLAVGDCFAGPKGMYTYTYSAFKLNPFADGVGECGVATANSSFSLIKSLY
ncbi:MAG: hypothetical protein QF492_07005 [Candidatus Krumholzibacteria bacterium]|jgi:hypothetical protein|nr:hypothetical protein [Candidatus Krumholzibacteria bacterium]MDP6669633.1 hypothetical protein [Candidatus Krumholzibacteria bacterium]MDP7022460.1 hypothetical protein [Candidatus Krumholzibacteria bacterium]